MGAGRADGAVAVTSESEGPLPGTGQGPACLNPLRSESIGLLDNDDRGYPAIRFGLFPESGLKGVAGI